MSPIEVGRRWPAWLRAGVWGILIMSLAASAAAADAEVEVFVGDDDLLVDVRTTDLVNDDVQRALRSGLPARVRLRVELWARRSVLWDELVLTVQTDLRVVYLLIDERFDVLDDTGQLVFTSADAEDVARWVGSVHALPLCALDEVESNRSHYVTAELRLDPLTVEELRDLRRWLRGAFSEDGERSSVERLSGQLLGVVKGKLGLGDRRRRGRSADFELDALATSPSDRTP